jgi:hypothetical protein
MTESLNALQSSSIPKKTKQSLSVISEIANNGIPMFSREPDLINVQVHTQLQTPDVSSLISLFFQNTEQASIKKTIKQFNNNMTEITEDCEKACLSIVDSIMDKTTTFDFKPEEDSGNSLAQLTSGIMGMLSQSVKTSKSEQLETKKIKKLYSQYLNFECHEAFINTIKYDGKNLTMLGGNIKYDQILSQQLFIETSLREQLETDPTNRNVKSVLQRFIMLTKITELFHLEITSTFVSVANKITGEEDVHVKFDKHLTSYVKSITSLLPYLKMMFPLDTRNAETISEFKHAEFDNIAFASMSDTDILAQKIALDKSAADMVTRSHVQYVDSTANYVKEVSKSTTGIVTAPVVGIVEGVGKEAYQLTGKFVEGLSSMVGKTFYGPIGIMVLIALVFAVMCWTQSVRLFISPFVFVKNATYTIIKFAVGNVYYVFEKVRTRIIFKGIEKKRGLLNTPVVQRVSELENIRYNLHRGRLNPQIENEEYVDLNIYRPPLPRQPRPPTEPYPTGGFKKSKRKHNKSRKHKSRKHKSRKHKSRKI